MQVTLDLTATTLNINISQEITNLGEESQSKSLRRRIVAVSEGKHNGILFSGEEIRVMVDRAIALKEQEKREYFAAPLVLDHSHRVLDKVGATYNLFYDEERRAAIADVEFWQYTPMLQEVAKRVEHDPENTYFSVRVKGNLRDDNSITDLQLIHIAVVLEPADKNARIIEELKNSKSKEIDIMDLGVVPSNPNNKKAEINTPWQKPTLKDFTSKSWEELSDTEKRRIASHFAWAAKMPPDTFGDLKLPHHRANDGAVVWNGVRAAMAALMGARGGVQIPAGDKRKVYSHLATHYKQFDKTPPNFEALEEAFELLLLSDLYLNTSQENSVHMTNEQEKLEQQIEELTAKLEETRKELESARKENEKIDLIAEIIAIDSQVDREFIKSLSKEQLEKYKADLERRTEGTKGSTEKSLSGDTGKPDPFELAEKYYGPVEVN